MRACAAVVLLVAGCMVDRSGLATGDTSDASDDASGDAGPIELGVDAPQDDVPDLGPPDMGCGMPEICNGLDDDCDGVVDGPGTPGWMTSCRDMDGDGHGNPSSTTTGCTLLPGYLTTCDDCDDGNPAVFPGTTEACNARDDDCDGMIDQGAVCSGCTPLPHGTHGYLFCTETHSFTGAEALCNTYGYHLATIDDAGEDAWVATTAHTVAAMPYWIGYTDSPTPYHWVWSTSSYTGWGPMEPSGGTEHCALTDWYGSGANSWNDADCMMHFMSVCETPP